MTDTVLSLVSTTIADSYGVQTPADFTNALNAMLGQMASNNFKDAPSIVALGLPCLARWYATLGLVGVEAVQNTVALLQVGTMPFDTNKVYLDRGKFLKNIAVAFSQVFWPAFATEAESYGVTPGSMLLSTPLVDRFARIVGAFYNAQRANPTQFAPIYQSTAIRCLLQNFLVFDTYRVGLQATVPCATAPSPVAPNEMSGMATFGKFGLLAYGAR